MARTLFVSITFALSAALTGASLSWGDVKPREPFAPESKGAAAAPEEEGIESQTPREIPEGKDASSGRSEVKRRRGWRMLKPLQKVLAVECRANPIACLCPPETLKTVFQETAGWGKLSRQMYMCQPTACPEGKILQQRRNTSSGELVFRCEVPGENTGAGEKR